MMTAPFAAQQQRHPTIACIFLAASICSCASQAHKMLLSTPYHVQRVVAVEAAYDLSFLSDSIITFWTNGAAWDAGALYRMDLSRDSKPTLVYTWHRQGAWTGHPYVDTTGRFVVETNVDFFPVSESLLKTVVLVQSSGNNHRKLAHAQVVASNVRLIDLLQHKTYNVTTDGRSMLVGLTRNDRLLVSKHTSSRAQFVDASPDGSWVVFLPSGIQLLNSADGRIIAEYPLAQLPFDRDTVTTPLDTTNGAMLLSLCDSLRDAGITGTAVGILNVSFAVEGGATCRVLYSDADRLLLERVVMKSKADRKRDLIVFGQAERTWHILSPLPDVFAASCRGVYFVSNEHCVRKLDFQGAVDDVADFGREYRVVGLAVNPAGDRLILQVHPPWSTETELYIVDTRSISR